MNRMFTIILALLVSLSEIVGTARVLAADTDRGTTLVCGGFGGDGLSLAEWTADELANNGPIELAHPQTGTCHDPAGLTVGIGWTPGTKWLCSVRADGRWYGPEWTWEIYQTGNQVPPDPTTGHCPQPMGYPQPVTVFTETWYAAATAVHLTELEVAGNYPQLYAWMHPDSKAIVPEAAMEGWYRDEFENDPPIWMTVDGVQLEEWTWDVTGRVYPSAAKVTYRQRFADGHETKGVTHLVRDDGVWRWFFGSDRAFVEEQITTYGGQ